MQGVTAKLWWLLKLHAVLFFKIRTVSKTSGALLAGFSPLSHAGITQICVMLAFPAMNAGDEGILSHDFIVATNFLGDCRGILSQLLEICLNEAPSLSEDSITMRSLKVKCIFFAIVILLITTAIREGNLR